MTNFNILWRRVLIFFFFTILFEKSFFLSPSPTWRKLIFLNLDVEWPMKKKKLRDSTKNNGVSSLLGTFFGEEKKSGIWWWLFLWPSLFWSALNLFGRKKNILSFRTTRGLLKAKWILVVYRFGWLVIETLFNFVLCRKLFEIDFESFWRFSPLCVGLTYLM